MKPLHKFSKDFFDKYKEKPVKLHAYGPRTKILAGKYIDLLTKILDGRSVKVGLIGSAAYGIPASDIEVAVYVAMGNRDAVLKILEDRFGKPSQNEKEFSKFEITDGGREFDIHVYSGYEATVSEKLTKFMIENRELIDEYRHIKEKSSFSRREYQYQKDIFLNRVIESIPEDF